MRISSRKLCPITCRTSTECSSITAPKDVETQELCRKLSVPYYATNVFYKDGDKFNKARGIDFGLSYLRWNDWVVHLDADTILPPMARRWLEWRPLDTQSIYGVDRVNCVGYEAWKAFQAEHHVGHDYMCRVRVPSGMPLLDRIAIRDYGGYIPIGYFQMWHGSLGRRYPVAKGDAEHTDVLHAIQWDEGNRHLIPEVIGGTPPERPLAPRRELEGPHHPRFAPGPVAAPYPAAGTGTPYGTTTRGSTWAEPGAAPSARRSISHGSTLTIPGRAEIVVHARSR